MDGRTNLDRHLRGSKRLDLSGVDWDAIGDHPLTAGEVRCLTYMMDIESHTMVFLRDLLATRAVEEPELTGFLACWVYEELWHGEALSRFLGEAGVDPSVTWDSPYPSRVGRTAALRRSSGAASRRRPWAMFLASAALRDFSAVHMAWGAVNELSTLTAYLRIIESTRHPVLADLLHRLVRDERRHYSFYRTEAQRRLEESPAARRLTRFALDRWWSIVGTGVRPLEETDFIVLHLFGDDGAGLRAQQDMDATVDSLPGLAGLRLFRRARDAALRRRGRAWAELEAQAVPGLGRDGVPPVRQILDRQRPVVAAK